MEKSDLGHTATVQISASPDSIYEMISDLTRMGNWSPENTGGKWLEGEPGQVGAKFLGTNKMEAMGDRHGHEWESHCYVTVAEPGSCFEFTVGDTEGGGPYTRWTFDMKDDGAGGTDLSQTWSVLSIPPAMAEAGDEMLSARNKMLAQAMEQTVAGIKAEAEA